MKKLFLLTFFMLIQAIFAQQIGVSSNQLISTIVEDGLDTLRLEIYNTSNDTLFYSFSDTSITSVSFKRISVEQMSPKDAERALSEGSNDLINNVVKVYKYSTQNVSWLTYSINSGFIIPNGTEIIDLLINSAGLIAGDHFAQLIISSNDASQPITLVDITLQRRLLPAPFTAQMTSLNSSLFPQIIMNVDVDTNGLSLQTLTASDFTMYENQVLQTDCIEVIPPNAGGGIRVADIVFIIDNSGSMSSEQAAVINNIEAFVDSLRLRGVDVALGLTRYGQMANSGNPIIEDNGILTTDVTYFKDAVLTRNVVDGGSEPGYFAITESANNFSFRAGSQKIFIEITDETPDQGGATQADAISALVNNYTSFFAFSLVGLQTEFQPLIDQTNGYFFDILMPMDAVLDSIFATVSSTYIVKYCSDNPNYDGKKRSVSVFVNYQGNSTGAYGNYIPGSYFISRTNETIVLSDSSWQVGTEFSIKVNIFDNAIPYANQATLLYKTTGTSTYASATMVNIGGDTWEGIIPIGFANAPGIDYYITSSDGLSSVSSPLVDPNLIPYQIAISPNYAPVITHIPMNSYNPNNSINITAEIFDITNYVASVELYYREVGQLTFVKQNMNNSTGNTFDSIIPSNYANASAGIEYYIRAVDDYGVASFKGTQSNPLKINPTSSIPGQTIIVGYSAMDKFYSTPGTIIKTYNSRDNSLLAIDTVRTLNANINYSISLLDGQGGVRNGDTLYFRLVDSSNVEVEQRYCDYSNNPIFLNSFPPNVITYNIKVAHRRTFSIPLVQGYNAVSWNVKTQDDSLINIFSSLLKTNQVQIILAFKNDGINQSYFDYYIPELGGYNSLQKTSFKNGYFIKLKDNSSNIYVDVNGLPVCNDIPINLNSGYNFIPYLPENSALITDALQNIDINNVQTVLKYVNDGLGNSNSEYFEVYPQGTNFNSFDEGKAYFIQMTTNATLTYPAFFNVPVLPKAGISKESKKYLLSEISSVLPTEIYVFGTEIKQNSEQLIPKGSLIEIVDSKGKTISNGNFNDNGVVSLAVKGDNPLTADIKEGAIGGEELHILINGTKTERTITWTKFGDVIDISGTLVSIKESIGSVPNNFDLSQNYPNPFNPSTKIKYSVAKPTNVEIVIFNMLGQKVQTLVNENHQPGKYEVDWNTQNQMHQLTNGIYIIRMRAGDFQSSVKAILLK